MRKVALLVCIGLVAASASNAWGARCSGISNPVFCDDFDCWCNGNTVPGASCTACSPTSPETDPNYVAPDVVAFRAFWPADGDCSGGPSAQTGLKGPGSWKAPTGYMATVAQHNTNPPYVRIYRHTHDMTTEIMSHSSNTNGFGAVNGAGDISAPLNTDNTIPLDYVDSMSRTLRPQALKGQFFMDLSSNPSAYSQMIYYTELYLDEDRAPTDFVRTDCNFGNDCFCLDGACDPGEQTVCMGGPRIGMPCTDDVECAGGPTRPVLQKTDNQIHASFAVGIMALMDTLPCDDDFNKIPTTYRMVVYDGLNWNTFQAPRFGIPMQEGPAGGDSADLRPEVGYNIVYYAIGADYIEVRLYNGRANTYGAGGYLPDHDPGTGTKYYFVARVPREYKGPFNRIALGPGKGVELNVPACVNYGSTTTPEWYRCDYGARAGQACDPLADPNDPVNGCPASTTEECLQGYAANNMNVEEVVLYDGVFQVGHTGACCNMADMSCTEVQSGDCTGPDQVFRGENTTCSDSKICCRDPFARIADNDADVDQADFAVFQACYTGDGTFTLSTVCKCLDHDLAGAANNAINADDWAAFEQCASGPGIPADANCD